eukprot:gene4765-biopygen13444
MGELVMYDRQSVQPHGSWMNAPGEWKSPDEDAPFSGGLTSPRSAYRALSFPAEPLNGDSYAFNLSRLVDPCVGDLCSTATRDQRRIIVQSISSSIHSVLLRRAGGGIPASCAVRGRGPRRVAMSEMDCKSGAARVAREGYNGTEDCDGAGSGGGTNGGGGGDCLRRRQAIVGGGECLRRRQRRQRRRRQQRRAHPHRAAGDASMDGLHSYTARDSPRQAKALTHVNSRTTLL